LPEYEIIERFRAVQQRQPRKRGRQILSGPGTLQGGKETAQRPAGWSLDKVKAKQRKWNEAKGKVESLDNVSDMR
jgi:hypothetical protein